MKILIIDDNLINLKLLKKAVDFYMGIDSKTAIDHITALETIEKDKPDVILIDIELPGVDGLTLTTQIKENSLTSDIKIIAVTAYAMTGDKEKTIAAGCDAYISKPIHIKDLIEIIKEVKGIKY